MLVQAKYDAYLSLKIAIKFIIISIFLTYYYYVTRRNEF